MQSYGIIKTKFCSELLFIACNIDNVQIKLDTDILFLENI